MKTYLGIAEFGSFDEIQTDIIYVGLDKEEGMAKLKRFSSDRPETKVVGYIQTWKGGVIKEVKIVF